MRFVEDGSNTRAYMGSGDWAINGLANDDFGISSSSTGDLVLGTGAGTERLRIDNTGRVSMPYQPAFFARHLTASQVNSAYVDGWSAVTYNVGNHFNYSNDRFTEPIPPNLPQLPVILLLCCLSPSEKVTVVSSNVIELWLRLGLTKSELLDEELLEVIVGFID